MVNVTHNRDDGCPWFHIIRIIFNDDIVFNLLFRRRSLAGSLIGGIRETQEMLDFCAEHGIVSDIELIPIDYINTAYERMLRSDVKYRFVIDIAASLK